MKIIGCTLLCDRKAHYQLTALPAITQLGVDHLYVNIQSEWMNPLPHYVDVTNWLQDYPHDYDIWGFSNSTWRPKPKYDQHQVRLAPIVTARNMAIDFALSRNATHLLFIDSDVIPHPGGLEKLLSLDKDLCGGYVPGRGAHSHVKYVFGSKRGIADYGESIECDHGTCGYMLISRRAFGMLRFRWGDDPEVPGQLLSEDPAYCEDWYRISGERFWIHKEATADHVDDPRHPLTEDQVAKDNWNEVQPKET